jgi:hypothetical protein
VRARLLAALMLLAVVLSGCSARSDSAVTTQSIAEIPTSENLLFNPAFTRSKIAAWHVILPRRGSAYLVRSGGHRVLVISASAPGGTGLLLVHQTSALLPVHAVGSQYVLRVQLRRSNVSRTIYTELRLNYAGGGYGFFYGTPMTSASPPAQPGIRGTTPGWVTVVVHARAQLPVESIEAMLADSRPDSPFSGSVAIGQPDLRAGTS